MTYTTQEALRLAEEAFMKIADLRNLGKINPEVIAFETLYIIRAARAQEQAEQDLDTCPGCGGVADNGHDREFPPNPYYCTKCIEQAEPVAFQFPRDTESWTGGWTIDYKVIRSVDAEIEDNEFKPCLESVEQVLLALEKVYAAPQPMKQEPVAFQMICPRCKVDRVTTPCPRGGVSDCPMTATAQNAAPVRTKDLTDAEVEAIMVEQGDLRTTAFARAVIAADREKNK